MSKHRCLKNTIKQFYNSEKPILFDVSLRDGIQGMTECSKQAMTTNNKIDIFHNILFNYSPKKIEIGSIVNPKILPIMSDSLKIHKYAEDFIKNKNVCNPEIYIVVPNKKAFDIGFENGIKNFSFLTSVSNSFQKKNVNKTIHETITDLRKIYEKISSESHEDECKTKLYISCINDCPFEGKIDNDIVLHEILNYHVNFPLVNEYCLSDTCGSLKFEDFKYIINACIFFGIPPSKISLHLHINKQNISEVEQIIFHSLDNNIIRFDVSILETGGCSVTLPSSQFLPNLSYELFNNIHSKYVSLRSNC
jgi:hydroxymethylglutaryl-CoA lyase